MRFGFRKKVRMDMTEFVYVTYINATPENVWNALLDNEMIKQYWGRHKNVSDWKVGSIWLHQDYDTDTTDIEGKVIEVEEPKRLVLTWAGATEKLRKEKPSRVTFIVELFLDVTRLTVKHDELEAGSKMLDGIRAGVAQCALGFENTAGDGQASANDHETMEWTAWVGSTYSFEDLLTREVEQ